MLDFTPLASGSSGNVYRVSDGEATLLIECGLPIKALRRAMDFGLSELDGCLVSHEHGDHAKAVPDLLKAGVDVWASAGTLDALGVLSHHRANVLTVGERAWVGSWLVTPFAAEHDAAEPLGFVVDSYASGHRGDRLFFSGDTNFIRPQIADMSVVAVECNNTWEAVRGSEAPGSLKARIVETHMSLETVKGFLAANDLRRVREIWLLHLSDDHSDAEQFRREVMELCGKEVRVA